MSTPSLAVIPSGYKASKLYSQLPINGDGDLDVVRSTVATRVNEQGEIEEMGVNVPRLDYTDGGCPVLLIEPTGTNLVEYSEDFSQWISAFNTVLTDTTTSPRGVIDADKLESTNISNNISSATMTLTVGQTYTFSCFAKKDNNDWIRLGHVSSGGTGCWFDLVNGVVGQVNSQNATITDYGNGWYRCTNTFVATNATQGVFIGICDNDNSTNAGSIGQSNFIYGGQVEEGTVATSYIKNSGNTAGETRSADVVTLATSGLNLTTITETFADDSTNVITPVPTTYTVSQGRIKEITGE